MGYWENSPSTDTPLSADNLNDSFDSRGVDVWLQTSSPASVTDWGPVIQDLVDGGARHLLLRDEEFPFSTPLDLSATNPNGAVDKLRITGVNGDMAAARSALARGRLVWTGGAGSGKTTASSGVSSKCAIDCYNADGLHLENLGIYFDDNDFDGDLVQLGHSTFCKAESCSFGTYSRNDANLGLGQARSLLSADSLAFRAVDCAFRGGHYHIRGREHVSDSNPDDDVFDRCQFESAVSGFFCNIGNYWKILNSTFYGSGFGGYTTPTVIDFDLATPKSSSFTFQGNDLWDNGPTDTNWIEQKEDNAWSAVFRDNRTENTPLPYINLAGSGNIIFDGNVFGGGRNSPPATDPLIDLGDATTDARKDYIRIVGNYLGHGNPDAVVIDNIAGHDVVDIHSNIEAHGFEPGLPSVRAFRGHERLQSIPRYEASIAAAAGQPTLEMIAELQDHFGLFTIKPTSGASAAGHLATITLGDPGEPSYGNTLADHRKVPLVHVFPYGVTGSGGDVNATNLAATHDAGIYASADASQTGAWKLYTRNSVGQNVTICVGYRAWQL